MAFSSGGGNKAFSPFTITAGQVPQQPTATSSFTFGTGTGGTSGFTFGTGTNPVPAGQSASAPQLSFTAPTPVAATTSSLFSFGSSPAPVASTAGTVAPSFGFGAPSISASSSATSLGNYSTPPVAGTPAGLPSFGTPLAAVSTASSTPQPATAAPISFTSAPPAATANTVQPTFGVPATSQPAAAVATPATTSAAAAPLPGFSFGGGAGAAPANSTNQIRPITTTAAGTTGTTGTVIGGAGDSQSTSTTQLSSATTTTQSNTAVSQMNFRQLQEAINKWMLDLQEQEKIFLEQATKVNAWDRSLISNGDKIAKLNESITKVKNDHTRLEHALDYLKTQQQEFERFLEPLEAGLPVNIPVEPEREHLYSVTESVDTQLQQMAEDLKEVIRHINESNKTVDKNDPISQILRILNEHTDALQWVEDNANQVRRSLEDVSKQHQMAKKEHERSLRQMFK